MSHTTSLDSVPINMPRALKMMEQDLISRGINVELVENAVPRLYYKNQLQMHLGVKSEVCPYVLRVKDPYYDIGFVPDKNDPQNLTVVFDDFAYVPSLDALAEHKKLGYETGSKSISQVLGCAVQSIPGEDKNTERLRSSVGKMMSSYTASAIVLKGQEQGLTHQNTYIDPVDGSISVTMVDTSFGGGDDLII